jgi:large subunit ribosomal protein L25
MTATLRARIPLRLTGDAPAIRIYGGMLVHPLDAIEVEALPGDLPQTILVDVSGLTEVGSSVLARDLPLPDRVTMLAEPEEVVATVVALRSGTAAGEPAAQAAATVTQGFQA